MVVWLSDSQKHTILFADYQVVMAGHNKLIEEYKNWGLEVNTQKTW